MEIKEVPIGFTMALVMNEPAMTAYAAMTEPEKQEILNKAQNVKSKHEMRQVVDSIANRQKEK